MQSKKCSGNQGKHQKFFPSILPYKFGLIFISRKTQKNEFFKIANSQKDNNIGNITDW